MSTTIMYGNTLAKKMSAELKKEVEQLHDVDIYPTLTVLIIGDNPASKTYVRMKQKACEKIGIQSNVVELQDDISESELLGKINQLNQDPTVHGILVQLPLPQHINEKKVLEYIHPQKDVDGFHPINVGRLAIGHDALIPCTPIGIIKLLESYNVDIQGKHAVIIGRSNIVGKPIGQLLLNQNATVTYTHSKTNNLSHMTRQADILIVAVGKAQFISEDDIKEGAVIVDVGNTFLENGKVVGDVDFESVKEKANKITPVPKGVGPMTITMLLHNTIKAARNTV
ncbi:bifunctional methylenetetrahydrofolate dehydrogenase/methenyltetrahydrofolate cyclohydrolase FolD [Tenuibacillus multivorans]|uniref:Bifunctional protein FolD n=1 Tax=Tenuibacillus multivorans TaxID=237069 RepID=A0A1G9Z727_9BACI|nr:bifunctional methylenetetrahydrofolate dehydrogenase/methenyltetrahydrofolate cyclohydrolase FolD [Tenuibacillus multivorans]GEL77372.1 bifunctional protein FolD [Tenuibacillus multivorans]SDN17140.1 methylenetetrahydrofolate dehydrogenase (NADP+) / methenyltetrahydrofolate cyclohydrolase [Tenuibacillus multivorans]